jgi:uncharacterized membrane protein YidH (DUF202 family)
VATRGAVSKVSKHDVALAEVQRKANRETILAWGFVAVAVLAVSYFPLSTIPDIVEPFAGKTTTVDVNVIVGITATLSLSLNVLQFVKGRSRRRELKRQRNRLDALEEAGA